MTYRQVQLIPDLVEAIELSLHLTLTLLPETSIVGLFESDSRGLLQRANAREADTGVCGGDILDQMLRTDQVAYSPACSVEQLACASNGQG